MGSNNYYRNYAGSGAGGWGTDQYRFPAPQAPNFQPQPSWGGQDFYRAHAGNSPDLNLYNRVMGMGHEMDQYAVGMNEARHWHRRAYGGLGNATSMLPSEMGHAAAYEAYRTWIHNSSMYEPLSGDIDRQREGLIGLAVAEAARLIQYSGLARDGHGRMQAAESAASTAAMIFDQSRSMDDGMDGYRSRSRSRTRTGSFSNYGGASPYRSSSPYGGNMNMGGGSPYMAQGSVAGGFDPYEYDVQAMYPRRRHRRRSRSGHRSRRHSNAAPIVIAPQASAGYPGYGAGAMPIAGSAVMQSPYAGSYGGSGSYGATGAYGMAQPLPAYGGGVPMATSIPSAGGMALVPSRRHRHSVSGGHRPRSADGYRYGNVGGGFAASPSAMGAYRY